MAALLAMICRSIGAAPTLGRFFTAPRETTLARLVKARPEIFKIALRRYQAANWSPRVRAEHIIEHCKAVDQIGGVIKFPPGDVIDLVRMPFDDTCYRITLDQARWLMNEGLLTLSLWDGIDRTFSIAFSLRSSNGALTAYVGGLQGRKLQSPSRYRSFGHFAFRTRPQDFLVEVFKMFCRKLGVSKILAVEDCNHCSLTPGPFVSIQPIALSYDAAWRARGAVYDGCGFYSIPVSASRRDLAQVSAKKRGMYRERYELFDEIERSFTLFGEIK